MATDDKLTPAESIRAKMLGEHLIRELRVLPPKRWHTLTLKVQRAPEGGVTFADTQVVEAQS